MLGSPGMSPSRTLRVAVVALVLVVGATASGCSSENDGEEIDALRDEIAQLRADLAEASVTPTAAAELMTPTPTIVPATPSPTEAPKSQALDTPTPRYVAATGGSGVSLRSGCSDSDRVEGSWPEGSEVLVVAEGMGACVGWWEAEASGARSWVLDRYLSDTAPTPTETTVPFVPAAATATPVSTPAGSLSPVISAFCDGRSATASECAAAALAGIDPDHGWRIWATGIDVWERAHYSIDGGPAQTQASLAGVLSGLTNGTHFVYIREDRPSGMSEWSEPFGFTIRLEEPVLDYRAQQCAYYQQAYRDAVAQSASQIYLNFVLSKVGDWCG